MASPRKSTAEQLEALRQKEAALKAKMGSLEARKRAEDRRRDTRRAFVVGAAALAGAQSDPAFRDALRAILRVADMREGDRAVIADLLGLAETPPAEAAAQTEAA